MGSNSQAIRYPIATTGAENIDALNRVLADLCTRSNPKDGDVLTLRRLVEEEARYLSGEAFARFMDYLYERITTFLDSNEVSENLGALKAIDELIDVTISENTSKVAKFSNYMRAAFETKSDPKILVLDSKVLGHLARSGGAMTADEVERQAKVALEWLRGERIEYRCFATVLILKGMAKNASTGFNVHVPEFVDAIWVALRNPTLVVREKVVEALCVCLRVIEKRETRYYRMFEATQDGLGRNAPVHCIHGSLLAVGELLRFLGDGWLHEEGKDGASLTLRRLVEEEARDLSGEAFACFMDHLYERITTFLDSNEVSENLGALRAIDELIDVTISENTSKVAKFSNYIRAAFETKRDPEILVLASKVLGYLARSSGAMTADEVERQVKVALEWLRGERIEYHRLAAVLILKVLVGVKGRNTGEFMMSRYREVAEIVLRYLEHRDRLVHLSITSLLPRIAHFLRNRFVTNYLTICMNQILHVLKIPAERASGFIPLGEMAGALDGELINYLPTITSHLRDAVLSITCKCASNNRNR
ncbi:hypothetical protein FXO37_34246 [Capsicum annuum]|nr:hypothetical protein FXO37_34246 [Capsicum annuum]